jgi:O-antigen ligase
MNWLRRITLPPLQAVAVLLAVSIPVSVALDNLLLAALLLFGLLGCACQALTEGLRNPVARSAWLLFGMLLLATLYGPTPWGEAMGTLGKYADLALVPLFMVALTRASASRLAMYLFMLVMAVTLLLSASLGLGFIGPQHWMWRDAGPINASVFRSYITQNMMMSYAVFLALLYVREITVIWKRVVFEVFVLLGATDVLFFVQGRTGYLVLFALLAWFVWSTLEKFLRARGKKIGWKPAVGAALFMVFAGWGVYHTSDQLRERVDLVISGYKAWQPNVANATSNAISTGERLEFYYNSMRIFLDHPLAGVGTGGFPAAYAKQVAGTGIIATQNPHSEYLMLAVQGGLPALALMLYWLYVQWREAPRLENMFRRDAARGLVITVAVSCLVNSSLLDHTEGLFFAFMSALLFANLRKAQP